MKKGDVGYTLPWALNVVQGVGRRLWWWVRGDYPVADSSQDTMCMRIERRKDGFHVWPPEDETYYPSDNCPLYNICVTAHGSVSSEKRPASEDLEMVQRRNLDMPRPQRGS
jgi:hypothetical protein